jgi:site-specific recombinase XerD
MMAKWMAPRSLLAATQEDVDAFIDSRHLKTTNTRRNYLTHIGRFFDWAMARDLVAVNPTARIEPPKQTIHMPRPFSESELTHALDPAHFGPAYAHRRTRCWVLLGALGGLRCQEMAGLDASDIDREQRVLHIRKGKGSKERDVPMHPDVLEALEALPVPASGVVFPMGNGERIKPYTVSQYLNRYLRSVGIEKTAHALRHTFATNVYRSTGDILLTQRLLGHSSVQTTQIYAGPDMSKAAPAVMALSIHPRTTGGTE